MTKKLLQAVVINSEAITVYNKKISLQYILNIENCVVKELIPYRKLCRPFKIKFNVDVRPVLN